MEMLRFFPQLPQCDDGDRAKHGATSGMMPRLLTIVSDHRAVWLAGCNSPLMRSQSPESEDLGHLAEEEDDAANSLAI